MKSLKIHFLIIFLCFVFIGIAQDSTNIDTSEITIVEEVTNNDEPTAPIFGDIPDKIIDLATSLKWYEFLFILGFNLLGYLSPFIPVLRKIGDTEIRIGVGAIVLIMIFASMDINMAWKLVIEFFVSTKLYDLVFKAIKKTPAPSAPTIAVSN